MIFLLLSILSSTSIFVVFKLIGRYKVNAFSAIIINYLIACSAGFFLCHSYPLLSETLKSDWLPYSIILGVLFIIMFWLMGYSVLKAGVSTTTVATKMSVIIPILFTIAIEVNDTLTPIKIAGIILALTAVFLASYKPEKGKIGLYMTLLPMLIFVGMGIVDSMIKYAQFRYISNEENPLFSGTTFCFAGLTGLLLMPFNRNAVKDFKEIKTWILGILLGFANFGSMYFFIGALNHIDISTGKQIQGSIIFGINNIGIVALGVLMGFLFFRERPSRLNWSGIVLSLLAMVVLSFSQR